MPFPSYIEKYLDFAEALAATHPSLRFDEPMSCHTTWRVGGPAAMAIAPESKADLLSILELRQRLAPAMPVCILGKGSNVLFDDEGYDGLVIFTSKLNDIIFSESDDDGYTTIHAECGASLTLLSKQCVSDGNALEGLAFAYGIPGTIGGAVVMNAGAYGGEMSDVVSWVEYYDMALGKLFAVPKEQLSFSYRHSIFTDHPEYVVLSAVLRMKQGDSDCIVAEMAKHMTTRRLKQPLELPNAGSVFKRPEGTFAGKLIEDSGLKGFTIGGAQVSEKHAGFIVNTGNATASDIKSLIAHVQHVIYINYGIQLEREVRMISSDPHTFDTP